MENRLVSRSSAGVTTQLHYDPLGRLYHINDRVMGITRFLQDGDALIGGVADVQSTI